MIASASKVHVSFADGTKVHASVLASDPFDDLAVLRVDVPASALHPLAVGSPADLGLGDPLIAIGNPFDLERSVSVGVVSGLHRRITAPNGFSLSNAVQTDAAINHANSGGPLLDAHARVVGIAVQIADSGVDANVGVGFGVLLDATTKRDIAAMVKGRTQEHAWLGVSLTDIDAVLATSGLERAANGALVTGVVAAGPAAEAGVRGGSRTAAIDLVQLHCPPDDVIADDALFADLDELVADGWIAAYGVSVETCDQALAAIARPGVATVQIILNAFRLKPLEQVLPAAQAAGIGIIARVPLASGLLSGRYDQATRFSADDHRSYNRNGEAFDVGETFSGLDYATGLEAVRRLAPHVPEGMTMAQWALRFVLDQPGVSVVIPGARNAAQARGNAAAADLVPLDADALSAVHAVYDELIRPAVHSRW